MIRFRHVLYSLFFFFFFFIAGLCEIGGGYLVWLWLRESYSWIFEILGGFVLLMYGVVPTLQKVHFHRTYAAYGGIFVVMAIIWGLLIDKKRPDRYELIGGSIVLIDTTVIFYAPR